MKNPAKPRTHFARQNCYVAKRKSLPLVSVIITAYNAGKYVREAVESILNQTYKNLEIIIVNDGSTDNTLKTLISLKKEDKRIKLTSYKKNCGPSFASNIAISQTKGKYLARMDADDIAFADRIEKQLSFLLKNPKVIAVGGQCILIDENGQAFGEKKFSTKHNEIYKSLFRINPIQHPTCMINRQLLPGKTIFYDNGSYLAHDLELIFKLAQYGKLANLKEPVLYYRQRQTSLSLKNPKKTFIHTLEVRKRAVKYYQYRPSFSDYLITFAQTIGILLLPNGIINTLWQLIRYTRNYHYLPKPTLSPALSPANALG